MLGFCYVNSVLRGCIVTLHVKRFALPRMWPQRDGCIRARTADSKTEKHILPQIGNRKGLYLSLMQRYFKRAYYFSITAVTNDYKPSSLKYKFIFFEFRSPKCNSLDYSQDVCAASFLLEAQGKNSVPCLFLPLWPTCILWLMAPSSKGSSVASSNLSLILPPLPPPSFTLKDSVITLDPPRKSTTNSLLKLKSQLNSPANLASPCHIT